MKIVGVRELKAHLSETLEAVEAGEVVEVTNHGRSVARIVPIYKKPTQEEIDDAIARVDRLAEEIGKYATPGVTVEQIMSEIRN